MKRKLNLNVNIHDVFSYDSRTGIIKLGGQPIPDKQIESIQSEIKFIQESEWWKIINETMRHKAIEKAIYKSTSFNDMRNGKEMLEVLKLINELNYVISQWRPAKRGEVPRNPIQL